MGALWILLAIVTAGEAMLLSDEEYYQMPRLFHLDDYEECLAGRGAFCAGSFHLAPRTNSHLLRVIEGYSNDSYHFNRSRIHRGLCVTTTCSHIGDGALPHRFETCVDNLTRTHYGLEAQMYKLEYCKAAASPPRMPVDQVDLTFAGLVLLILLANLLGTIYDFCRNPDNKPNRYIIPWSLRYNWNRLTADHENGDARLNQLNPLHGIRTMTLVFVMMAHSIIVYHITYIYNPQFLEIASQHPLSTILHNGSVIVQTFVMLSSFLLAYNLLVYADDNPKKEINFRFFPNVVLQRFARITPVHLFVVGLAATWWRHASDGPLWPALVESECLRCRDKWWAQALYINNFVKPDDKCLLQTWFLAVDMQLYIVAAALTLALLQRRRLAVPLLAGLFLASMCLNFVLAYLWDLKPILFVTYPELMRHQYAGEPSFIWLYTAPWGSLPASLLGLLVAFLYHRMQTDGVNLDEKLWFRVIYRLSVPAIPLWILGGYFVKEATSPEAIAFYAAIDRPVFTLIVATCMVGFFFKVDSVCWQLMSWRGWRALSRMSLSVLMVHWGYNLTQVAIKTTLSRASIYEIAGHWFVTMFMTYVTSIPLYLLVEAPFQKFIQAIFT